jgi:hypothetical protein
VQASDQPILTRAPQPLVILEAMKMEL